MRNKLRLNAKLDLLKIKLDYFCEQISTKELFHDPTLNFFVKKRKRKTREKLTYIIRKSSK